jgi:hypothetical protein
LTIIPERPEIEWLPSRHRFALSRLVAFTFCRPGRGGRGGGGPRMYAFDPNQTAAEHYLVSVWVLLTTIVYIAAALPWPRWAAVTGGIVAAPWVLQLPVYLIGNVTPSDRDNRALVSKVAWALLLIPTPFVAMLDSPAHYAAWLFIAVFALNGLAFVVMLLLRRRVEALEARCAV